MWPLPSQTPSVHNLLLYFVETNMETVILYGILSGKPSVWLNVCLQKSTCYDNWPFPFSIRLLQQVFGVGIYSFFWPMWKGVWKTEAVVFTKAYNVATWKSHVHAPDGVLHGFQVNARQKKSIWSVVCTHRETCASSFSNWVVLILQWKGVVWVLKLLMYCTNRGTKRRMGSYRLK